MDVNHETHTHIYSTPKSAINFLKEHYHHFDSPPKCNNWRFWTTDKTEAYRLVSFLPDEDEDCGSSQAGTGGGGGGGGKMRNGGSHIHLWQFLKELLQSPGVHGSCIRWLDRGKGVFKIEDSVRVARLWGKRKNRPAMNYDKLSRSIRQYYKKGIMKKTERSQRLVYQFCHPYCL